MIKFFLTRILAWAASVNWTQFVKILPIIREAAVQFPKVGPITKQENAFINAQRAVYAAEGISRALGIADGWQVNLLRELALAWLNHISKK